MPSSELRTVFERTAIEFIDVKYITRSLHGTKHFCTWEYDCTLKNLVGPAGDFLKKDDAIEHVLSGVALMWWNDEEKLEKIHQYTVHRDVEAVKKEQEGERKGKRERESKSCLVVDENGKNSPGNILLSTP